MKCPIDNTDLMMTARQGIEIDYCPTCRGIWLDRGELDKLIERASAMIPAAPPPPGSYRGNDERNRYSRGDDRDRYRDDDDDRYHRRKRRGSFLDDLFDF